MTQPAPFDIRVSAFIRGYIEDLYNAAEFETTYSAIVRNLIEEGLKVKRKGTPLLHFPDQTTMPVEFADITSRMTERMAFRLSESLIAEVRDVFILEPGMYYKSDEHTDKSKLRRALRLGIWNHSGALKTRKSIYVMIESREKSS